MKPRLYLAVYINVLLSSTYFFFSIILFFFGGGRVNFDLGHFWERSKNQKNITSYKLNFHFFYMGQKTVLQMQVK